MNRLHRFLLVTALLTGFALLANNQDSGHLEYHQEGTFTVHAVYVDSHGAKWFGTNRGLYRLNNMTWTYYTEADHLPGNRVYGLAFEQRGPEDLLWVATGNGVSALGIDENGITGSEVFTQADGLLDTMVSSIAVDSRGVKFFGSASGISMYTGNAFTPLTFSEYYNNMFNTPVRQLELYGDTLYVAQDGGTGRLVSGVDGITGASRWESSYGVSPYSDDIRCILVKGEEVQYFGTGVGVQVHTGYQAKENWSLWNTDSGLVDNRVISIAEDSEGGLWFGTLGGVSHFSAGSWMSYTTSDGLIGDTVYDIGLEDDGSVWFATSRGACRLFDGEFQDFLTSVSRHETKVNDFKATLLPGVIRIFYRNDTQKHVTATMYTSSGVMLKQWDHLPGMQGDHTVDLSLPGMDAQGSQGIWILLLRQGDQVRTTKLVIAQ